jgi:hypothetical protein
MENQEDLNNILGVVAIVLAGLSFFITTLVFGILALVLGLSAPKKGELHVIAIILAVFSIIADLVVLGSYY